MRRLVSAVGLVVVYVVLAACDGTQKSAAGKSADAEAATLSSGDWTSGDEVVGGVVGGILGVDDEGCLYVPAQVGRDDIIWPAGYTSESDDGAVSVLDPNGDVVAQVGKPFAAKGLRLTNAMFEGAEVTDARQCRATTNGVTIVINSELPPLADWYTRDSHVVTLYHCGPHPTEFEGSSWVVSHTRVPFDGPAFPRTFVGRGSMVRLSSDKALYTDESGVRLRFVPADSVPPKFCA